MMSASRISLFLLAAAPAMAALQQAEDALLSLKEKMTVYQSDTALVQKVRFSWMEQFQMAAVQPCGGNGHRLAAGAVPFDTEFRRSWLGADIDLRTGTHFSVIGRVGGLPHRYGYENGRERKDYSYTDFYELWVKQDVPAVEGLSVKLGKVSPLFTTDYINSASKLMCVERSVMGGPQYGLDSNWGVEISYSPTKADTLFFQLLANDRASDDKDNGNSDVYRDGRGAKGEFGWEDKCYAIIGGDHRFAESDSGYQQLSLQYAHDFDNTYDNGTVSGANYFGLNVKDALSLGHEWKHDRLTFTTNVIANAEMRHADAAGNNNNLGWQLQPVYSLTPHVDLVMRYVGMTGRDACKLGADRYVCRHTGSPKWVDSLHSLYMGANFYLSEKDKHAAKLMLGAEYLHARKEGDTAYCGWEFTSAVRWNF